MNRSHRALIALLGFSLVGCVAPDLGTSEVAQEGNWTPPDCDGCGGNGFDRPYYDDIFGQLNRNTLDNYCSSTVPGFCLWNASTDGPISLCKDWAGESGPGWCNMRDLWMDWVHGGTQSRMQAMREMVKCIAPKGYIVRDTRYGLTELKGEFHLRGAALLSNWDYRTQETVTACLLALLDPVPDVPVCLVNEERPSNCGTTTAPAEFEESVTYGKHFRAPYVAIAGGKDAANPEKNRRYGLFTTAAETPATAFKYRDPPLDGPFRCSWSAGEASKRRYATSCTDDGGVVWNYPVTVRTPFEPGTFYYGHSPTRPGGLPIPY